MKILQAILLITLTLAPVQIFAQTSIGFVSDQETNVPPPTVTDAKPVVSAWARQSEIYENTFKRIQGELVPLTDAEGNLTPELFRLVRLRRSPENFPKGFSESDLLPTLQPINRYEFQAKYPYVADRRNFYPLLSLYDARNIKKAAHWLSVEMGWDNTAAAMRESVEVCGRIDRLLSGTPFALVALRPLDFFAKDGARIGLIFSKRTKKRSTPEMLIYFLDPTQLGNTPDLPPGGDFVYRERDENLYIARKADDGETADFVRAFHREVESAVLKVSRLTDSR